jgi:nucleoside triphosphate pyrophosphatase
VKPIVLASSSPRRLQLLDMLGIPCRVVVPEVDETRGPAEVPEEYVVRLARAKVRAVAAREPGELVLGADTTVVVRGEVLGKPESFEEAEMMLGKLAGRTHHVMTGVALGIDDRMMHALDVSDVTFRSFDRDTIEGYVATGEPMDKAGGYAVQGRGAALVESIRGDYFSVMGLPLRLVLDLLERFGRPYRFTR